MATILEVTDPADPRLADYRDLRDVEDAEVGQFVLGEGGDGDRGVLQGLLAALRRDHDFLEAGALGLVLGGGRESQARGGRNRECDSRYLELGDGRPSAHVIPLSRKLFSRNLFQAGTWSRRAGSGGRE